MTPLREFEQYTLLGQIAEGGMGVVYQAVHRGLNRSCALKLIRTGLLATPDERRRFVTEAEAAAKLDHPNIVRVGRAAEFASQWFLEMELVEGGTLADRIAEGPLPPPDAARLLEHLARAVQHAHERGILHRDLKPANVLLTPDGEPKLTDFGLARFLEKDSDLTRTIAVLGTPAYMAPELASGRARDATIAADVYSLGVILFECLTGQRPFRGETPLEILRAVLETATPRPSSLRGDLPSDLEVITLQCLAKEPECRLTSAGELADELARFLRAEPIRSRPVPPLERLWLWCRRKPALATACAAAALAIICAVAGISWQLHQKNQALRQRERMGNFLKEIFRGLANTTEPTRRGRILDAAARRLETDLKEPPELQADVRVALGAMYYSFGDFTNAVVMYHPALDIYRAVRGTDHEEVASLLNSLGVTLQKQGDRSGAEPFLRESLDIWRRLLGPDDPKLDTPRENLAFLARRLAQGGRADCWPLTESLYREAWEVTQRRNGSNDWIAASKLAPLVQVLHEQNKFAEATPYARRAVDILEGTRPNDYRTFQAQSVLGANLSVQGQFAEAEKCLTNGHRGLLLNSTNNAIALLLIKESAERVAAHYAAAGPPEGATRWQREFGAWSNRYAAFNAAAGKRPAGTTNQ